MPALSSQIPCLMLKLFFQIALFLPFALISADLQPNILTYEGGNVQVNSEINEYETIVAGKPIQGSIMITHDIQNKVNADSFRMGNQALHVEFVRTTPISNTLAVTIYQFQIKGLAKGIHNLPPINVKVGNKEYQAPPLAVEVE